MSASIAQAVSARRVAFDLSQEEVAHLAGLPVSAVRLVETSRHDPTASELARLAGALAVDPAALWRGDAQRDDPARGTVRFLAGPSLDGLSARDRRLLARATEVGRLGRFLWDLLGKSQTILMARRKVTALSMVEDPWQQGYALAESDRLAIANTEQPLASVQGLLEDQGVHVAFVDFDSDDVIAASLAEPNALPVVLLNRHHPRVEYALSRRSVLAHELCHVLHDSTTQNIVSVVSRRTQEWEPWEQRANAYGPSFLVPAAWVGALKGGPRKIVRSLAASWLLSWEGGCWHAKNLGLVAPDVAEGLIADGPRGWRAASVDKEPIYRTPMAILGIECEPTSLVSGLLSELVAQAFAEGEISRRRAEEILNIR